MTKLAAGACAPAERESCACPEPPRFPFTVRYEGRGARGGVKQVAVIRQDMVMIRRECEAGVPLYVSVPLGAYRGLVMSVRLGPEGEEVGLRLDHRDGDLAVPIIPLGGVDEVWTAWDAWGAALGCALLVEDGAGVVTRVDRRARPGEGVPQPRRANRFFAERRPRFLTRRRVGGVANGPVLREDEIIARSVDD